MWYCSYNGEEFGPFSQERARLFVKEHPGCSVWKEGMPEWIPAKEAGFEEVSRTMPSPDQVFSSDLAFEIKGDDMQFVEFDLEPDQTVIAEPGSMIYKQYGIEFEATLGNGKKGGFFGKLWGAGKRALSGENFFIAAFTNTRERAQKVAFSAPYPGKIIPVSLKDMGGEIICQKDSFLCAQSGTEIGIFFQKKILTAMFGGAGFVMQSLKGDGVVFIHAGGTIHEYTLNYDESLQVDAGCLVAFEPSVSFDVTNAGSLKAQIFGGAGLFFAEVSGPGRVWVQSLPFSRFARRLFSTQEAQDLLKVRSR